MKNNSQAKRSDIYTTLQLVFSALVVAGFWILSFILAMLGIFGGLSTSFSSVETLSLLMMSAVSLATGFLVMPSAGYAAWRITGRQVGQASGPLPRVRVTLLIILFPVVLWLGDMASGSGAAWLVLPLVHIIAVGLPVAGLLALAVRELPLGSLQRRWGVFASGLVLGPALILMAELFALLVFLFLGALWVSTQPGLMEGLMAAAEGLAASSGLSQEELVQNFLPYLLNPTIIALVFIFTAMIVPLIEEIFKPIGVWLLMGRKLTPAAGFAAGALCGAGYALFESLVLTIGGENWAFTVMARIGTAAIHILTAALTGWALVLAWRKHRYLNLLGVYALAVFIHGLWNGFTVLTVFATLGAIDGSVNASSFVNSLGAIGPYFLGVLSLGSFAALIWLNRRLAAPGQRQIVKAGEDSVL